ncbi:hypothetical protein [Dysgonomonas sp. ZJ279]|nr:hypothetical protein [Dysgonomonas sp. ZJ279]
MEYYLGIDTSLLTNEQWAAKYAQLHYIREKEKEQNNKANR